MAVRTQPIPETAAFRHWGFTNQSPLSATSNVTLIFRKGQN